ncbi:hypothetical protein TRFO_21190 [Tritrichomonas foetus]|uniref:Uncharacterized protein n=1 Tax=Tritrichomonas foetus TaxID=1144522 RepID=A0A1J4KEA9_9EUKA|nr:hypothetical protein TRFO_21190 [Tritrichomonas foetus]|eukprot:OHT09767.1 hypothetical protein TRFO_21190 [Tritrichomonas foetus]
MSQAKSNKPNNNNQNNFDDDSSDDDAPWEPEDDFNEVFIRVDENNNCVISGPPEKVAKIKEQIVNAVLDGQDKIAASKLNSINSFEFQMQ